MLHNRIKHTVLGALIVCMSLLLGICVEGAKIQEKEILEEVTAEKAPEEVAAEKAPEEVAAEKAPEEAPPEKAPEEAIVGNPDQLPENLTVAVPSTAAKNGWVIENERWFYYAEDGSRQTGWIELGGKRYYLAEDGVMQTNWVKLDTLWYYLEQSGAMVTNTWIGNYYVGENGVMATDTWIGNYYVDQAGKWVVNRYKEEWIKSGNKWWYRYEDGSYPKNTWFRIHETWYYFNEDGWMQTDWLKLGKTWYYLYGNGAMATDWIIVGNKWYYLDQSGAMQTDWLKLGNTWYYLNQGGDMKTGWHNSSGRWYYLGDSGAMVTDQMIKVGTRSYYINVDGIMQSGWMHVQGHWYYAGSDGAFKQGFINLGGITYFLDLYTSQMSTGWVYFSGKWYYFYENGMMAKNTKIDGYYVNQNGEYYIPATATIKILLQKAILPIGSTMYVYGGGWTDADATRIGISPQWKTFCSQQDASYDFNETRYQRANGLDCSGFVGWAVYNALNTEPGKENYTASSGEVVDNYTKRGWGTKIPKEELFTRKAGDIMGKSGHTWITIGRCADGSVVYVHSSPKGVQINGSVKPNGDYSSEARTLANTYMKKYFADWSNKFGVSSGAKSYLTDYDCMRWNISGNSVMADPDGYTSMSAEQVLRDLFGE